jgi:hypothetical protein
MDTITGTTTVPADVSLDIDQQFADAFESVNKPAPAEVTNSIIEITPVILKMSKRTLN